MKKLAVAAHAASPSVWPQFADAPRKKQAVAQSYNPVGDATGGGGLAALRNTQAPWQAGFVQSERSSQ